MVLNRGSRFQTIDRNLLPENAVCVLGIDLEKNEYELEPFGFTVYLKEEPENSPLEKPPGAKEKPDFMQRIRALLGL